MLMEWIIGVGAIFAFCFYIFMFNWGWWKLTNEKIWDETTFGFIVTPILIPLVAFTLIALVVGIFVMIPIAIGNAIL